MTNLQLYKISKEIQEKANIVDVIGSFIKLKKMGANYVGVCPFHNDTKPSLTVSPKKHIWKCFVCGVGGDVIQFVKMFKKCTLIDAIKIVGDMIGFDFSSYQNSLKNTQYDSKTKYLYDSIKNANDFFIASLNDKKNMHIMSYLSKRGINEETIKHFKIGYAPATNMLNKILTNKNNMFGSDYDKNLIWNEQQLNEASLINISQNGEISDFFIDRVTFPIFNNDGAIVGFSARTVANKEPKYLNSKENAIFNKSKILYNFHNVLNEKNDTLILVEGFMDVIAYHRAGIKNVVATMGTNLSNDHINLLKSMPDIQTIVLSFDNDRAGKTATIANGIKLLEQNFRVFVVQQYSEKYKDVDELLQNEGAKSIENIIANQDDYILYLIKQAFSNDSMVLADKITKIQKILSIMVENDDILLKTLHFEALSKFSKLSISDIESQYRALLNKKYNEYGYKAAKKQIDEEIAISNQTPVSKLKSEIDECKYKMNIIGNVIANSLAQLISFSLHNSEIINLYEKQLQFSDMSKHFKLESKILKALLLVKKNNEQEIINFFQENDPKDADNIKYYLENLKLNTHFDLNSVNIDIAKKLVLNINIKKIEFANANLAIQMCIEEENGKDPVIINGLLEEIMQNNEKKKKIISIYY